MTQDKKQFEELAEQIYQLTTLVAGRLSLQEVLDRLAEAAVKIVGVKACSIRLLDEEAGDLKMRSTYGLSEAYRNKGVVSKDDPVIEAAFSGQAVILDDMRVDGRVQYKEATIEEGLVSQLTVAMMFRGEPIGVLRLYSPQPWRFGEDDIQLARAVASQCAVAITNARLYAEALEGERMAEQMRLAGLIQRKMIPQSAPQIEGLDIGCTYIPCFDVGGDLYDFLELGEGKLGVAIADVIGKGMPAALMMSGFRSALRAYVDIEGDNIAAVVNRLNRIACRECGPGEFISLFYAVIDARARTITYCNCGHEPTLLLGVDGTRDLDTGGFVLGIMPEAAYEIETVELKEHESLIFYTDGLIDAANFDRELWGRERLIHTARRFMHCSAVSMIRHILGYRRRFVGLARQIDDTSMVVVRLGSAGDCPCPSEDCVGP
ncbi:MAG TPA: GAF domain-containing protein [Phycisphaerales bacterium]|nr:GAF domain-containing protein [Phycisphaerales bacterium]